MKALSQPHRLIDRLGGLNNERSPRMVPSIKDVREPTIWLPSNGREIGEGTSLAQLVSSR